MHFHTPVFGGHSRIGQSVECLAVDERPKSTADMDIRARRIGGSANFDGVIGTGRDLIAAGMKPGPQLGQTLQNLLQLVLEDPSRNSKEYLLSNLPKET